MVSMPRENGMGSRPMRSKLGIEEAQVELGVVDDQRRIADEGEKIVNDVGKGGCLGQHVRA